MATLESGYNPTYSENASILTGRPNRVTVEVEDTIDRDFWSDLLGDLCPEKEFHFDPYHTVLNKDGDYECKGKGKSRIINASVEFNSWHIGCVDSDYDNILSDYTDYGKAIISNKYLLQTYTYSIENLMCLSCTLDVLCCENTEEYVDFDFVDYLTKLSKAIYPLLVWSTYLCSKGNQDFVPTDWRKVLVNTEKDPEVSLACVEAKAKTKIEELENKYADEISEKVIFEFDNIIKKDVTDDDAYLYVRGHELFDHILYSVLTPVITKLRNQHYAALKASDTDEESRKAALRDYQAKANPVEKMLSHNYRYKNKILIYKKIWADVMNIWL